MRTSSEGEALRTRLAQIVAWADRFDPEGCSDTGFLVRIVRPLLDVAAAEPEPISTISAWPAGNSGELG